MVTLFSKQKPWKIRGTLNAVFKLNKLINYGLKIIRKRSKAFLKGKDLPISWEKIQYHETLTDHSTHIVELLERHFGKPFYVNEESSRVVAWSFRGKSKLKNLRSSHTGSNAKVMFYGLVKVYFSTLQGKREEVVSICSWKRWSQNTKKKKRFEPLWGRRSSCRVCI